jgi:glutaredoxin
MKMEKVNVFYIYDNACATCENDDAYTLLDELLPEEERQHPYSARKINIFKRSEAQLLDSLLVHLGSTASDITVPAILVGKTLLCGEEAIRNSFASAFKEERERLERYSLLFKDYSPAEDHLTLVYFYREQCQECVDLAPFIDALPDVITVQENAVPLDIIRIDTRKEELNREKIYAFFDAYGVPEDRQFVPVLFLNDTYLMGYEEITGQLIELLQNGHGLHLSFPGYTN